MEGGSILNHTSYRLQLTSYMGNWGIGDLGFRIWGIGANKKPLRYFAAIAVEKALSY